MNNKHSMYVEFVDVKEANTIIFKRFYEIEEKLLHEFETYFYKGKKDPTSFRYSMRVYPLFNPTYDQVDSSLAFCTVLQPGSYCRSYYFVILRRDVYNVLKELVKENKAENRFIFNEATEGSSEMGIVHVPCNSCACRDILSCAVMRVVNG